MGNGHLVLQNMTGAFLYRDRDGVREYLLMKRADDRPIAPGMWSSVGGKMEPEEINDPMAACLREIAEETGITQDKIEGLTLRYLLMRHRGNTISQSYIFFGSTDAEPSPDCLESYEGSLHWVRQEEVLTRTFSATHHAMLRRYFAQTPEERAAEGFVVGTAENNAGSIQVRWSVLDWFEK